MEWKGFEGAPTVTVPAGSTAGPSSFVRDFFGNGYSCPRGARGVYRGVARGGGHPPSICNSSSSDKAIINRQIICYKSSGKKLEFKI